MGLDTGALGPRICDRSSCGHPGMGTRVSIHRTACLSDLVRQRPLSASRGETRCDTYRNRHPCTFGAEDSRLETSACRLTRKRTPPARSRRPSASRQPHLHRGPPGRHSRIVPRRPNWCLTPGDRRHQADRRLGVRHLGGPAQWISRQGAAEHSPRGVSCSPIASLPA